MENEKRLISLDEALKATHNEIYWTESQQASVRSFLVKQPKVDAVEVVHGQWEDMYGGKYANPRYRCSVCKEIALYKHERDFLGSWQVVQALTPNCPYCTAKMDMKSGTGDPSPTDKI